MEIVALDDKTSVRYERRPRDARTRPYGDFCQGVFDITPKRDSLGASSTVDGNIKDSLSSSRRPLTPTASLRSPLAARFFVGASSSSTGAGAGAGASSLSEESSSYPATSFAFLFSVPASASSTSLSSSSSSSEESFSGTALGLRRLRGRRADDRLACALAGAVARMTALRTSISSEWAKTRGSSGIVPAPKWPSMRSVPNNLTDAAYFRRDEILIH